MSFQYKNYAFRFCFAITVLGTSALLCTTAMGDEPGQRKRGNRAERGDMQGRGNRQAGGREGMRRGPGGPGEGRAGGPQMMQSQPLFRALDANQDGSISTAEMNNATAALRSLDKDSDGTLSSQELRPQFGGERGKGGQAMGRPGGGSGGPAGGGDMASRIPQMFKMRDANGDGKLSGDEIPERMAKGMERLDTNGDGALTEDELVSGMKKMGGRQGQGQGKRGGRGDTSNPGGDRPKRPSAE